MTKIGDRLLEGSKLMTELEKQEDGIATVQNKLTRFTAVQVTIEEQAPGHLYRIRSTAGLTNNTVFLPIKLLRDILTHPIVAISEVDEYTEDGLCCSVKIVIELRSGRTLELYVYHNNIPTPKEPSLWRRMFSAGARAAYKADRLQYDSFGTSEINVMNVAESVAYDAIDFLNKAYKRWQEEERGETNAQ